MRILTEMKPLILSLFMALCLVYTANAQATLDSALVEIGALSSEVEALYADYQARGSTIASLRDSLSTIDAEHEAAIADKDAQIDSLTAGIREIIVVVEAISTRIE